MKSTVETLSPTRVKLTVEVPFEELQPSLDEAFKRIASQVNVPGFRKGKVPSRIIEQRFGRGMVLEEAVNDALPKAYDEALREHAVVPVGRPEVEITRMDDGEQLEFTAEVDVRPEFDLPDFASLRVEVAPATASDEEITEQIDALRTRFANLKEVDRAAADGDVLLVDISGHTPEEDPVDDLSGKSLSYELGTDGMLPGFDEAVRGASKDEVRSFTFTPQNGDWAGIELTVNVEVKAVRERELPELNDEFAQLASEFDTAEELRADLVERVARMKRLEQGAEARQKVHEVLIDSLDIPLPEAVIQAEVDDHFATAHGHHGHDHEGHDHDHEEHEHDDHAEDAEHRAEIEEQSRLGLKSQFILDKIAEAEELSVGEAELSMWLMQQAPRYGMSADQFAQALVEAGQVPMALSDIRRAKALAVVLERATVVDTDGNPVDLKALDADLKPAADAIAESLAE